MYRTVVRRISAFYFCLVAAMLGVSLEPVRAKAAEDVTRGATKRVEFARMLPPETLAYVRAPDASLVREEWWKTSIGRMAQDPQFKPLLDQAFAAVEKAFEPVKERLGLSLAELLGLSHGECGVAIVGVDGASPALLFLMEVPEGDRSVATLLERGRATALAAGWIEESESVGDLKLNVFRSGAGRAQRVLYLRREGVLVIGTDLDVVKRIVAIWNGTTASNGATPANYDSQQHRGASRPYLIAGTRARWAHGCRRKPDI
ncbi:MAG: hypothetical protein K8U03_13835 [Planctomycetia bacterium]|nr:hypothetical protein [Planctomycetia bacterium]